MPFIFATAGAPSGLIDEISRMLAAEKDSTLGMICGFAPQMFILNHEATGFFLVRRTLCFLQTFILSLYSHMEAQTQVRNQYLLGNLWSYGP